MSAEKGLPFGPKYTGEGKLDFYAHDNQVNNFEDQKEPMVYEADVNAQTDFVQPSERMNYEPTTNTRVNDLSSYNKNPHPTKQTKIQQPVGTYYERQILAQADLNSSQPISTQKQGFQNYDKIDNKNTKKSKKQKLNREEELDSK